MNESLKVLKNALIVEKHQADQNNNQTFYPSNILELFRRQSEAKQKDYESVIAMLEKYIKLEKQFNQEK